MDKTIWNIKISIWQYTVCSSFANVIENDWSHEKMTLLTFSFLVHMTSLVAFLLWFFWRLLENPLVKYDVRTAVSGSMSLLISFENTISTAIFEHHLFNIILWCSRLLAGSTAGMLRPPSLGHGLSGNLDKFLPPWAMPGLEGVGLESQIPSGNPSIVVFHSVNPS